MTTYDETDRYVTDEDAMGSFDPLAAFSFDDEGDEDEVPSVLAEGPFNLPNPDAIPQFQRDLVSFANGETAEERIRALFEQMPTMQKMLFAILDLCTAPVPTEQLEERVDALKQHHHSVYTPLTLCNLLERAGAMVQTDEEGTPLTETEREPLLVDIDGVQYWRVAPAPQVYWSLTDEGRAQLDSYRPQELITQLYEAQPQYTDIFTTCLQLTAREGGIALRDIGNVVDDEPVLQSPRRFAMYFIDKLEHAGAVEWRGQWVITEHGRTYLAGLNEQ